jgi:cytoskeletal protein CcmA (bactofilin family)
MATLRPRVTGRPAWTIAALTFFFITLSTSLAAGKTTTWTGNDPGDNNWSTAGNWDNGVPLAGDDVHFDATGGPVSNQDILGLFLSELLMTGYTGTLNLLNSVDILTDFVADGTVHLNGNPIAVAGSIVVEGTLDAVVADIAAGGDITVAGTLQADGATLDVYGVGTSPGATMTMGACWLTVQSDVDLSDATTTWSAGAMLELTGGGAQDVTLGPGSPTLPDVTVQRSSPASTTTLTTLGGAVTIDGPLAVGSGVLDVQVSDITFVSPVSISLGGTISGGVTGANVEFQGGLLIAGSFVYTSPAAVVSIAAGQQVTVDPGATFSAAGDPVDPIRLQADGVAGGPQWIIAYSSPGDVLVDYAEVQDSDAQGPGPVTPTNSVNLGNNTNWYFGPKTTAWTGAAPGNNNWSDDLNWDNFAPVSGDVVLFTAVSTPSIQDISGLSLAGLDMTGGYTGTLTLQQPLDVTSNANLASQVDAAGANISVFGTLSIAGTCDATNANIILGSNLSISGTVTATNATINVAGSLDITGSLDATAATMVMGGDLTVTGSLIADGGSIAIGGDMNCPFGSVVTMGSGDLELYGAALASDGTMTWTTGTLDLRSSGIQVVTLGTSAYTLGHVVVNHASSSDQTRFATLAPGIEVLGDLTITRGTLSLISGDFGVAGQVSIGPAGRLHDVTVPGITMTFDGAVQVDGVIDVSAHSAVMSFGSAVQVGATATFSVVGGTGAQRTRLMQDGTAGGAQWLLHIVSGATTTFENVRVQDSDATPGETAMATGISADEGNNDNWDFAPTGVGDPPVPLVLSLTAVPNPFNPSTRIHYVVPAAGEVSLVLYDVRGTVVRRLAGGHRAADEHDVFWDGRNDAGEAVSSGAYFCRLTTPSGTKVQKLVLVR